MRCVNVLVGASCVAIVCAAARAWAAPIIFTDETEFVNALSRRQSLLDFDDAALGRIRGNEFAAQGFRFDSPLRRPLGRLNTAPPSFFASSNYLNIDRAPFAPGQDGSEDDLEVIIRGRWRAVGFRIIDAYIPEVTEFITVYGRSDNVLYTHGADQGAATYFGIITDEPIRRIVIDEQANDLDDVGYDDFRLGNPARTTVPEPLSFCLLGAAVLGLVGARRCLRPAARTKGR